MPAGVTSLPGRRLLERWLAAAQGIDVLLVGRSPRPAAGVGTPRCGVADRACSGSGGNGRLPHQSHPGGARLLGGRVRQNLVSSGEADGFVSAGSTGASLAVAAVGHGQAAGGVEAGNRQPADHSVESDGAVRRGRQPGGAAQPAGGVRGDGIGGGRDHRRRRRIPGWDCSTTARRIPRAGRWRERRPCPSSASPPREFRGECRGERLRHRGWWM